MQRGEWAMEREAMKRLLRAVRTGKLGVAEAMDRLRTLPTDELGFAAVDTHRALRRGFPEAIYGPGKTPQQVVAIVRSLRKAGQTVLVTRVGREVFEAVQRVEPTAEFHEVPGAIVLRQGRAKAGRSGVVVVTAGTSDLPVGEEAALTAELMGQRVQRIFDVGVAGLHRVMAHARTLTTARVIVAVAGMEGALPSLLAGMTDCPVIGVPTSTGYGAGAGGRAALLAMLSSCASGLTVVNIDNGYGAGCAAALINRQSRKSAK
jgi:NCAIR mutase (PurE)-related protein